MSMYLIQSLLLIAIAFILGCLFGGWLRWLFGGEAETSTATAATATAAVAGAGAAATAAVAKPATTTPGYARAPANDVTSKPAEAPKPAAVTPPPAPVASRPVEKKPEPKVEAKPAEPVSSFATSLPKAKPGAKKDDLKLISGIGPTLEKKLNNYGITTFEQIANLTPAQQAEFSEELNFPGRIERDNWIPQARLLADGKDPSPAVPKHDNSKKPSASGIAAKGNPSASVSAKASKPAGSASASTGKASGTSSGASGSGASASSSRASMMASLPKAKPGAKKDDLKLISGVGPTLEKKLNDYGITTFEQVANLTAKQQAEFGAELNFPGRIERDEWIPQARRLMRGEGVPKTATASATPAKKSKAESEDAVKAIAARSGGSAGGKDNLKRVRGIGPVLEGKLNAIGIYRFAQIAEWTAADRKAFNEHLDFPGRIEREEWVKQAKLLAQGKETEFSKRVDKGDVDSSKGKAVKPKNMKKS